jgi:hypothetical protein
MGQLVFDNISAYFENKGLITPVVWFNSLVSLHLRFLHKLLQQLRHLR